MFKRYTTLPSIPAEIFPFVELSVMNNPSSSDESIVCLIKLLNSLAYKVCKFAVSHALH